MKKIEIPAAVAEVLDVLERSGEEAYIVGGCVRDSIMGKEPKDWDITTSALPEKIKSLFPRTVDTGIKHGTVTVLRQKEAIEVTTFRVDGKYEDHRRPKEVSFTKSLQEDVARRDFTVNAMAYSPQLGLIDYFGGQEDLQRGLIRCVGKAEERFEEDALRMMRAIRFAAVLHFEIEMETAEAIGRKQSLLRAVSQERIRVEFVKTLASDYPEYLSYFAQYGLAEHFISELKLPALLEENFYGVLKKLPAERLSRLSYLLCRLGAGAEAAQKAKRLLRRLTFDNHTLAVVTAVVANRGAVVERQAYFFRKMLSLLGEEVFELLLQIESAEGGIPWSESAPYFEEAKKQPVRIADLAVGGEDILALGLAEGKRVGQLLEALLQVVLCNPAENTRERLMQIVAEMAGRYSC